MLESNTGAPAEYRQTTDQEGVPMLERVDGSEASSKETGKKGIRRKVNAVTISKREHQRLTRLAAVGQAREDHVSRVEDAIEDATGEIRFLGGRREGVIDRLSGEFGQITANRKADLAAFVRGMRVGLGRENPESYLENGTFLPREKRVAEMRKAGAQGR